MRQAIRTMTSVVEVFEGAALRARRSRDLAAHRAAIELYADDLLPEDRYEAWAEGRREGLRTTCHTLLVEIAKLYEECGKYDHAIETLRGVIAEEIGGGLTDLMQALRTVRTPVRNALQNPLT